MKLVLLLVLLAIAGNLCEAKHKKKEIDDSDIEAKVKSSRIVGGNLTEKEANNLYEAFFGTNSSKPTVDEIVNGEAIPISYAPYQIQLLINDSLLCGGSIIHESWVLTAAHCISGFEQLEPFYNVISGSDKKGSGVRTQAARLIVHEDYNKETHENDIALVELAEPLDLMNNPNQKAIPLSGSIPRRGSDVFISGFGDIQTSVEGPNYLLAAVTPVTSQIYCSTAYGIRGITITKTMFCAGNGKTDTCQGDSGGPAIVDDKLAGVTSFGFTCGSYFFPGVYTLVPAYIPWIRKNTGLKIGPDILRPREEVEESAYEIPQTNVDSTDEIVGGSISPITKAPWQVQLQEDGFTTCGGTIIHELWVLTAAHCLVGAKNKIEVLTGSMLRNFGTRHQVDDIEIHEKYDKRSSKNDIALIKLTKPIEFNKYQHSIKLAKKIPTEGDVFLSGYGTLGSGQRISYALRTTTDPIVSNQECAENYRRVPSVKIRKEMFCAGNGKTDTCQGDSGGPAVIDDELAGVVSFGMKCADSAFPGVYTSVPSYRHWISKRTGLENL